MNLEWLLLGLRLLATIILYTFLGGAFYLIWRELTQTAQHSAASEQRDQLRVVAIASQPDGVEGEQTAIDSRLLVVGQTLPLRPITLLGRGSENTIILNDQSISVRHARLYQVEGVWWLEDLDSKNGTRLNELPVSKPISLTHGDVIELGNNSLRLETREV